MPSLLTEPSSGQPIPLDPLYWRLEYTHKDAVDEYSVGLLLPGQHASVREAPEGAVRLIVITHNAVPILSIGLDAAKGEKPVFYRIRSGGPGSGSIGRLETTVFGRCFENGNKVDGTLWAGIKGRVVNCPAWAIDQAMIEMQWTR